MIEKLDDHLWPISPTQVWKVAGHTELEIKDNLARVIKNGQAGIWHQFSIEDHSDITIEVRGPHYALLSYSGKEIAVEISGLDLTFY